MPEFIQEPAPLGADALQKLSRRYARTRDTRLREALILQHQRLVKSIAVRFLGGGETLEDLIQVGNIGLINALDRYDPTQGTRFSTFATPSILGEIKRHFRDKTCGIKVPRWLQELHQATQRAARVLASQSGRAPTPAEIAAHLQVSEEDILLALECSTAKQILSLEAPPPDGGGAATRLLDRVGARDAGLRAAEQFWDLRRALDALEPRERQVILMRFFQERSQTRIARDMGLSQMHISRLQQRALRQLQKMLAGVYAP